MLSRSIHSEFEAEYDPAGFLVLTESPLFKNYFSRNWPLFGRESGFVMLGIAMILLGNATLGNLNKEATSQESLGLAFWRIVISSGIVVIVLGVVNILAVRTILVSGPS